MPKCCAGTGARLVTLHREAGVRMHAHSPEARYWHHVHRGVLMQSAGPHIASASSRGFLLLVALSLSADIVAGERIFRCLGRHGEPVFRDQPCSRAGLPRLNAPPVEPASQLDADDRLPAGCGFSSEPLLFSEPELGSAELRLVVEIDGEGLYLYIELDGQFMPIDGPAAPATFDNRLASQGLQFADGRFVASDWRMGQQRLGFGRSRMSGLMSSLSQQPASIVVWIEGLAAPAMAALMPPEEFRLAVDNARRCWKTQVPKAPVATAAMSTDAAPK